MTSQNPRGPQPSQPAEPGWWQASDGMWYPPESAPGATAPTPPPMPEPAAPPMPEPAAPSVGEPMAPPMPPAGTPSGFATAPAPAQTNGLALAALLVGIFGFCIGGPISGIVAVILGFLGMKKPTGKGMAITGIILGFVNIIVSGIVLVYIATVGLFPKVVSHDGGIADPKTYSITVDDCRVSSAGAATAGGTITNKAGKEKSFTIIVEFVDKSTGDSVERLTTETGIAPKENRDYSVFSEEIQRGTRAITCRVKEVRNYIL